MKSLYVNRSLIIFGKFFAAWVCINLAGEADAATWNLKKTFTGATDSVLVGSNYDGSVIVSAKAGDKLYVSTDGGTNWSVKSPYANMYWLALAVDSTGQKIAGTVYSTYGLPGGTTGGRAYITSNQGTSWTSAAVTGTSRGNGYDPEGIAMSADGTRLIVGDFGWGDASLKGAINISSNGGSTWSNGSSPFGNFSLVTSSATGQYLNGIGWDPTPAGKASSCITSSDYGATWSVRPPLGSGATEWNSITTSSSGKYLAGTMTGNSSIYTSNDFGLTWTASISSYNFDGKIVNTNVSGTGQYLIASGDSTGKVLYSSDFGLSWTDTSFPGGANPAMSINASGSKLIAQRGNIFYTSDLSLPTSSAVSATVSFNSASNPINLITTGTLTRVAVFSGASHGTATASGSTITYTPTTGYSGADSFQYSAWSADGMSVPATVSITVSPVSTDATLSGMVVSGVVLSPSFASGTNTYTASVGYATTAVTLTPTVNESSATVTVNGTTVPSAAASGSITLNVGVTTISTIVTAQDATTRLT